MPDTGMGIIQAWGIQRRMRHSLGLQGIRVQWDRQINKYNTMKEHNKKSMHMRQKWHKRVINNLGWSKNG